ncbi:hypothetical protein HME9304_02543 [Flagellimonas maritima]|uniref:DUF2339 domain-containing protein n=1 Tax=Flagellimonas maritima TaxID=1383885 RepID=A0A2Z4LUV8_9FLAO|nr:DUF2339 domain-containing protein [Allomuricauda aurantiaca]AWX45523.1 hypothetical protein HME9304_02543 [Allomuricauda aurantiaca]
MANQELLNLLLEKLELLYKKHQDFNIEINELRKEIQNLSNTQASGVTENDVSVAEKTVQPLQQPVKEESKPIVEENTNSVTKKPIPQKSSPNKIKAPKGKSNWEKFIGENLINKIGILITVIGVAIGAKYSIENNLISPLTRIILGYLVGLGLVGFSIKLKSKYENYSAVLLSGALAILYFITFAAYSFYGLFPQTMAFVLMLLFTAFGVVAALNYNKQVIAHIGLVGAYAIPFLLSDGSGNAEVLFTYMAIINIGIGIIAFKKYWKLLYYAAFGFSWLIFISWISFSYENDTQFALAFVTATVFFIIFYVTFLAYKLIKSEKFKISDIIMLLLNSFIYYGIGYGLLSQTQTGEELVGLFTLGNAIIHFVVSVLIFKRKLADKNLFYLISGLVLTFITIAIPVQLDGNWVTLLWAFEASLLFWIGRTKKVAVYEYLSYPLIFLSFVSLIHDWALSYQGNWFYYDKKITPFINVTLLTSIICILSYSFVNWVNGKYPLENKTILSRIMSVCAPALVLITLYFAIFLEIDYYFEQIFENTKFEVQGDDSYNYSQYNYDIKDFGGIWLINYSLLFLSLLAFANIKKIQNRVLGIVVLSFSILVGFIFLTNGLYTLSELRESYLNQTSAEYYKIGIFNVWIRYIAIAFFGTLLFAIHKLIRQPFMRINFEIPFEILVHTSILWIASSELLNWMDIAGSNQSYKLGLSILWGLYSLLLIVLGIWKKRKYLRIVAIVLFGITLLKLFFYDIASLNTISKTIVFVSLGVLLLIISFLYNKYKHIITEESEK